jgi:hypothetical protein
MGMTITRSVPVLMALGLALAACTSASPSASGGASGRPSSGAPSNGGQTASWTATGNLIAARYHHTATLLPDGRVLVAGGQLLNPDNALASAELYDPASGTWKATGGMNEARTHHTATLLRDGKVLVAGGSSEGLGGVVLASAELYDPASGTWKATGGMNEARHGHTGTLLPNGEVLVAGGSSSGLSSVALASAELYDPASGTWKATGGMNEARTGYTASLLRDGKMLVVGGLSGGLDALASAELYDPTSGTWTATGGMNEARNDHTATRLPDGKVLVVGGTSRSVGGFTRQLFSAELYDPATGTWSATGGMNEARAFHTATLLLDGKVLVAGGFDPNLSRLASAELFDPTTGTWSATAGMLNGRVDQSATLLAGGEVLVAAGRDQDVLAFAELYGPIGVP